MVHLLDAVTLAEHLVADLVEVLNTRREPGHLRRADLRDAIGELVKLGYSGDDGALRQRALNIDKEVYLALLARNKFGWLRAGNEFDSESQHNLMRKINNIEHNGSRNGIKYQFYPNA